MFDQKTLGYLQQLTGLLQKQAKANEAPAAAPINSPAARFKSQYPNGLIGAVMNRMQPQQGNPFPMPINGEAFPAPLNGNPFPKPLMPLPRSRPEMMQPPQVQAEAQVEPFGLVPPPAIPL